MENTFVDKELCAANRKIEEERQARDDARLGKLEDDSQELIKMNIRMGEILERHDKIIENHDSRITTLESKPNKFLDKIISAAISVIVSGVVGAMMAVFIK